MPEKTQAPLPLRGRLRCGSTMELKKENYKTKTNTSYQYHRIHTITGSQHVA